MFSLFFVSYGTYFSGEKYCVIYHKEQGSKGTKTTCIKHRPPLSVDFLIPVYSFY